MADQTHWIDVNGACLRYRLRGGRGRPMVLVHEMGGALESWDEVLRHLPAQTPVLCYDTRGAGLSEKLTQPAPIDTHVDDLRALMDALDLREPVLLAGVAVGAGIAIRLAARHPQRVSHLVAAAAACGVAPDMRDATIARGRAIAAGGMRAETQGLLDVAYPKALRTDEAAFQRHRCRWMSNDARSLGAIYEMLADMDVAQDLRKAPARTVLVAGTHDPLRPPQEIDRLAGFAPHAEALHVNSGHFMASNSPRWLATLFEHYAADSMPAADIHRVFAADPGHRLGEVGHLA